MQHYARLSVFVGHSFGHRMRENLVNSADRTRCYVWCGKSFAFNLLNDFLCDQEDVTKGNKMAHSGTELGQRQARLDRLKDELAKGEAEILKLEAEQAEDDKQLRDIERQKAVFTELLEFAEEYQSLRASADKAQK